MTDFARIPREHTRLRPTPKAVLLLALAAAVLLLLAGVTGLAGLWVIGVALFVGVVRTGISAGVLW